MTKRASNETRWLWLGLTAATALAVVDVLLSGETILIGLLVVPPLLVAARAGARSTAVVAAYAVLLSIVLGVPDEDFGGVDHLLRVLVVLAGGALAVWIASLRTRAEQADARSTFVAEAGTRLDTSLDFEDDGERSGADPRSRHGRLVRGLRARRRGRHQAALRSPMSTRRRSGSPRRSSGCYPFHVDQPIGVGNVIRTGEPALLADVTDATIESSAHDAEHAALVRELGLRSAIFVPLRARGRTLGAMAFATARSGRVFDADDFALAESLADRAALALDNAQLYTHLRQAEAELRESADEVEAVLQGVASAITVQDPTGTLIYANEAAADMLGFRSVDDLLDTPPEKIMERFEIFDEEGGPLRGRAPARTDRAHRQAAPGHGRLLQGQGHRRGALVPRQGDADPRRQRPDRAGSQHLRRHHEAEARRARRALPLREQPAARRLARLRGDARQRRAPGGAPTSRTGAPSTSPTSGVRSSNVALAHADPSKIELAEEMRNRYPADHDSPRGVPNVLRTGEPELYSDLPDELLVEPREDESISRCCARWAFAR